MKGIIWEEGGSRIPSIELQRKSKLRRMSVGRTFYLKVGIKEQGLFSWEKRIRIKVPHKVCLQHEIALSDVSRGNLTRNLCWVTRLMFSIVQGLDAYDCVTPPPPPYFPFQRLETFCCCWSSNGSTNILICAPAFGRTTTAHPHALGPDELYRSNGRSYHRVLRGNKLCFQLSYMN